MVRCMTGKTSDFGPTGITVTHRVAQLRGDMSYAELSRRLEKLGRPIPPLGLRRIEGGARRVDVDDLMALAAALGVSPVTLLMPDAANRDDMVEATAVGELRAENLFYWAMSLGHWDPGVGDLKWWEFMSRAQPEFERRKQAEVARAEAARAEAEFRAKHPAYQGRRDDAAPQSPKPPSRTPRQRAYLDTLDDGNTDARIQSGTSPTKKAPAKKAPAKKAAALPGQNRATKAAAKKTATSPKPRRKS